MTYGRAFEVAHIRRTMRAIGKRGALRGDGRSRTWIGLAGATLAAGLIAFGARSNAGHSIGHFPSYYPDEIRIDVVAPEAAGSGLADATLHAFIGAAPNFSRPAPGEVRSAKSLGAFLVLSLDLTSGRLRSAEARCAAARGIAAALGEAKTGGFVFHPYAITPYHADYLHHLDRIEAITAALGPPAQHERVGARGRVAEAVVKARFGSVADGADAMIEAVPVDGLMPHAGGPAIAWPGLPWAKEGWFQAYGLLASGLDEAERGVADETYQRLIHGELLGGLAERVGLERRLLAALTGDCRRTVVGYVPREEFFNEAYPPGAENIGFDAIAGLNAPLFVRTVKLKEYPWNGKLHLGVPEASQAAWNPVAGFTDGMGRLMWASVGDPAMIPFPFNASWMTNRVQFEISKVEGRSGSLAGGLSGGISAGTSANMSRGIKVPVDALAPEPGSGALRAVGDWAFASQKVTYEVLASPFDDGTGETVADVLYPYAFLYRWGAPAQAGTKGGDTAREPALAPTFAAIEERLTGVKVVRVNLTSHAIAEGLEVATRTPVVEVYLRDAPGDETQVASLAPPWSTVPWHLLALMEAAVERGWAAFSAQEAARRGVPWLDLVRDPALQAKLEDLAAQFERDGYRPDALHDLVSVDEARERWHSLREYAARNGHLLIANGPYRLKSWTADGVVLEAVREMTYPLGFGTFDRFVYPPRAVIDEATEDGNRIVVHASADMTLKGGRGTRQVREPLGHTTARGTYPLLIVSRYLLVDAAGKVHKVDKMDWRADGAFTIDLPQDLPAGEYTVILGIFLDGNAVEPSAKALHIRRIGPPGAPE